MNVVYNEFLYQLLSQSIDLANDTIEVALVAPTYTPDKDHVYWGDIDANEVTGTGYTGSITLENVVITKQDAFDNTKISADDVTWASVSVTARYAVVFKDSGDPATSPLILAYDFTTDQTSINGNFSIQWSDNGVATLSQSA